jgi:glycosyltransferase involved in cell wall biosynthesis
MNLLSIVTVNLNNKLGLQKTLNSIKKQNKKKNLFELIIIDGGSTDGSADIIKQNLKIIDYYVSEKDRNLYDAMNKGIKVAKNKFILFVNSGDTLISKNIIKKILLKLNGEINQIFRFKVHGFGNIWKSSKTAICHEAIAFLNKKKIFYDIRNNLYADKKFIYQNFERYGSYFNNLFILNFYLGGVSNNIKLFNKYFSLKNALKFFIYHIIGPKNYHNIFYKLKNYRKIK